MVSTPAWYSSTCSPEERRSHISSFVALSSPGPHAFLLCVPVNEPAHDKSKALDALEELFGPAVVSGNTVVLFTQTEELGEEEPLEQYIVTWRRDLQELVGRCGERYHTLEKGAEEGKAVEELLEKVEQAVKESGTEHFSCPLYQEAEDRVRRRQMEIVRLRRGEEQSDTSSSSNSQPEVTEEELDVVRGEAERSAGDLDLDLDGVFPPAATVSPSSAAPSLLWGLWEKLMGWIRWLPSVVRGEALLGSLVGLFLGGQMGGTVGATVGSVATEVSRRKTEKNK